ncbi:MAG: hypothetical protein IJE07_01220 [Clostridia bacterium]|nr:hypothetical protein [Clostridia bacterium]
MSTSATDRSALPTAFIGLAATLFCAVFGGVYEIFSHGVWSGFMVYAFLFPLVLEAIPFCWLALRGKALPHPWALNLHHAGTATLTVGSIFEGVLAIYGTTNSLTLVYWIAGAALLAGGLVALLLTRKSA